MPTSDHSKNPPLYMPNTENATHVYVVNDKQTGMMSRYSGPYKILQRMSDSTIKIRVGFFAGGEERVEVQHWSRCKPAFVREGQAEAEKSKLGRPTKTRPPSSEADSELTQPAVQTSTEIEGTTNENKQNSNRRGKRIRAPPDRYGY